MGKLWKLTKMIAAAIPVAFCALLFLALVVAAWQVWAIIGAAVVLVAWFVWALEYWFPNL